MMRLGEQAFSLGSRLRIEPDGTVVVFSGKVEYGQGIRTAFAMIVVEELGVPLERVRVVLGETDAAPWDMGTFGSMSVANDGLAIRRAAVFARAELLARAGEKLGGAPTELELASGAIARRGGGSVTFGELVANTPLEGQVPEHGAELEPPPAAEDAPLRLEARDIVTGRARFAGDVRLPNMLRGHVLGPPVHGARLRTLDAGAARAVPGVVAVVHEGDFAGVVAERHDQAATAARLLVAEWDPPPEPPLPVDVPLRQDEGVDVAFGSAALTLEAHYFAPHVAHASIGTSVAVADVGESDTHIYVATQRPFPMRDQVAEMLGLDPARVHVHPQFSSGTYGRNAGGDAALEAVRLSRAVGRPVMVQWSRAEEFRRSPHRPEVDAEISVALDASGKLTGWRYAETTQPHTYGGAGMPPQVMIMTSGRNAIPLYRVPMQARLRVEHGRIRTGAFRSLAAAPNVFAIESFMDEIAHRVGVDPVELRLRHLDDARQKRVLERVRALSGWAGRPREAGRGFGVACAVYHGSHVALVAEVSVRDSGFVRLERVWCAVDAGRLVHPDGARNQAEGAIQQAASWTLLEALQHDAAGRVLSTSFGDYPIATFRDAPTSIDVAFVGDEETRSSGMGETCTVPVAAAIANAVFDACGARVRTLPLSPAAVRAARGAV